jgi:glyoxylase-like metal-dependent hydrolase (beta-lactamase superfamily II)
MTSIVTPVRDLGDGVYLLPVPTPFSTGPTNVYLIDDRPFTVVDTGTDTPEGRAALAAGIGELGRDLSDVELVLLTHHHVDHSGMAAFITDASGATVCCLEDAADYLADFGANVALDHIVRRQLMIEHGVPDDRLPDLERQARRMGQLGSSVTITRPVRPGSRIEFASRTLEVHHRPGHSCYDTLFWDPARQIAFAGDHLLQDFASNALIERIPGADEPDYSALTNHRASLIKTQALGITQVLTGHGALIDDPASLIDLRLERQLEHVTGLLGHLSEGPRTAYELAVAEWGQRIEGIPYMAVSAALGHLSLVPQDGRLARTSDEHGVARFAFAA